MNLKNQGMLTLNTTGQSIPNVKPLPLRKYSLTTNKGNKKRKGISTTTRVTAERIIATTTTTTPTKTNKEKKSHKGHIIGRKTSSKKPLKNMKNKSRVSGGGRPKTDKAKTCKGSGENTVQEH